MALGDIWLAGPQGGCETAGDCANFCVTEECPPYWEHTATIDASYVLGNNYVTVGGVQLQVGQSQTFARAASITPVGFSYPVEIFRVPNEGTSFAEFISGSWMFYSNFINGDVPTGLNTWRVEILESPRHNPYYHWCNGATWINESSTQPSQAIYDSNQVYASTTIRTRFVRNDGVTSTRPWNSAGGSLANHFAVQVDNQSLVVRTCGPTVVPNPQTGFVQTALTTGSRVAGSTVTNPNTIPSYKFETAVFNGRVHRIWRNGRWGEPGQGTIYAVQLAPIADAIPNNFTIGTTQSPGSISLYSANYTSLELEASPRTATLAANTASLSDVITLNSLPSQSFISYFKVTIRSACEPPPP